MKVEYDKVADAVYMKLSQGKVSKTVEINSDLVIDLDSKGNTIGIEVLDVSNREDFAKNLQMNVANGIPVSINESTPIEA